MAFSIAGKSLLYLVKIRKESGHFLPESGTIWGLNDRLLSLKFGNFEQKVRKKGLFRPKITLIKSC